MNRFSILFIIGIIFQGFTYSQDRQDLRHSVNNDFKYDFYIFQGKGSVKYKDTLNYTWYKSKKIHTTQGHSEGNILNGLYSKFYHSGQLAEQGLFNMGLRDGLWKTWYESGNLKSISNYNEGVLSGDFVEFDVNGKVAKEGKYKKGKIHGDFIDFSNGDTLTYKNGEVKNEKIEVINDESEIDNDKEDSPGFLKRTFTKKDNPEDPDKKEEIIEDQPSFWKRLFSKEKKDSKADNKKKEKDD